MDNDISRRSFLQMMGAASLALPSVLACAGKEEAVSKYADNLGMQLYTVRDMLGDQTADTIKAIADIGYKHVELFDPSTIATVVPMMKDVGMRATGIHTAVTGSDDEANVDSLIAAAQEHGLEYLVYPWVAPALRTSLDFYRTLAARLNALAEKCKPAGLKVGYHNHAFEFEPMDGTTPFEILKAELQPELVTFEVDLFWATIAGHDPAEFIRGLGNHCKLLHLKDLKAGTPQTFDGPDSRDAFEEIGDGSIDFASVLDVAKEIGVVYCYVEQDATPGSPIESLLQSYSFLQHLGK